MNIKIKDNPSITMDNCCQYPDGKTALFLVGVFRKDLQKYRDKTKTSINNIAYYHSGLYNVRLTKTGNIKVNKQDVE